MALKALVEFKVLGKLSETQLPQMSDLALYIDGPLSFNCSSSPETEVIKSSDENEDWEW